MTRPSGAAAARAVTAKSAAALVCALALGACGGGFNQPLLPGGETALGEGLTCAPVGRWVTGLGQPISHADVIERAAAARIVLLGEDHGSPTHHHWQASVAAGILGRHPRMALAFEMLPRAAQKALDRYAAGATDENGFLKEADWQAVWGVDADHYLPLFRLGRLYGLHMTAINVSRPLVRRVAVEGWAAIEPQLREGVGDPAPATPAYRERLLDAYVRHHAPAAIAQPAAERFIAAQLLWDRAMAEALAAASLRPGGPVVALVGAEHAHLGQGIAHQLAALGQPPPFVMLTVPVGAACPATAGGPAADALFGIVPDPAPAG